MYNPEVRLEATGLMKVVTDPGLQFIATMVQVFSILQTNDSRRTQTDFYTAVKVVHGVLEFDVRLRCTDAPTTPSKQQCYAQLESLKLVFQPLHKFLVNKL